MPKENRPYFINGGRQVEFRCGGIRYRRDDAGRIFRTVAQAYAYLNRLQRAAEAAASGDAPPATVPGAIGKYLQWRKKKRKPLAQAESKLNHLMEFAKQRKLHLDDLDLPPRPDGTQQLSPVLNDFFEWLLERTYTKPGWKCAPKQLSASTIRTAMSYAAAVFEHAVSNGWLKRPVAKFDRGDLPKIVREPKALRADELEALFAERLSRGTLSLTRAELYERVWTTPLAQLAQEYGVSDVGLRKTCRRHHVPTPSNGHWARARNGVLRKRPTLYPAPDGVETVTMRVNKGATCLRGADALHRFQVETGCRPGEAARLRWDQVDMGAAVATIELHKTFSRTGKFRRIHLPPHVLEMLGQLPRISPFVFVNLRGRPYTTGGARAVFRAATRAVLERNVKPGALRHSFATEYLREDGASIEVLQEWLGHQQISTTQIYVAQVQERAARAARGKTSPLSRQTLAQTGHPGPAAPQTSAPSSNVRSA